MTEKEIAYRSLVQKRKSFRFAELLNPSEIEGGRYDCDHVEPWAQWMGNLNAKIMLAGKDFGGKDFFIRFHGQCDPHSVTNRNLTQLFACLGVDVGTPSKPNIDVPVFFTNAIVGIIDTSAKGGNRITSISKNESAREFLRPLIDIVDPRVIIAMGKEAYQGLSVILGFPRSHSMKRLLERSPLTAEGSRLVFPVFHCGSLGLANRPFNEQKDDWKRIRAYLETD
jgi:hypothetical protein